MQSGSQCRSLLKRANGSLLLWIAVLLAALVLSSLPAMAQATIQTGSIQGTVTDPSGAVVPGAAVTITNAATGQKVTVKTTGAGAYNSGPLAPGNYVVKVEAQGFSNTELPTMVSLGTITPGNVKLGVGGAQQTVTVEATGIQVNTEQPTVQGVLTSSQIENLPINGRNFLDAAQLEPGVQIQDGSNFDPTKLGYTGVSIGGRQGRTTRIEVDGLDITDETVGTTTQNIPANSVQEFQISQSSLDLSTELTSSGAVNVATKTGTNALHGSGFYLFRDKRAGMANFPGGQDLPFQRNHVGGTLGGPLLTNKLFFFIAGENIEQHLFAPVTFSPPFDSFNGGYQAPFKEHQISGRLDANVFGGAKLFYKFTYDNNRNVGSTLPDYQAFASINNTPSHAVGLDFTTGTYTHSVRWGYMKFHNFIDDASLNALAIAPNINLRISGVSPQFRAGPNSLAPQATFQSNNQIKYDGSKIWGSHIFRYGTSFNHILGGGFASFVGLAPIVQGRASASALAAAGPFPGGAGNPLNYPVFDIRLGNGQGFFTENPGFNLPAGGQSDNRFQFYLGDTWKMTPRFTGTIGLRYVRDTGRTDADLAPIPCSAINPLNFTPAPPCTGNLLDNFGNIPGLGNRVNQPNGNIGGQIGFSWDPFGDGKTAIRGGAGLYYENAIFNNVLFDRPVRLGQGLFNTVTSPGTICPGGVVAFPGGQSVTTVNGKNIASQICGQPIGAVANDIAALQAAFQAATAAGGATANPNFVGETLSPVQGGSLFAPGYESPRSWQMNFGIQREVWKGAVVSADYVRNVSLRYLLNIDTNLVGDSRFLNTPAALNAINLTNAGFGCPPGPAGINCAIAAGADISAYANNGLDSGATFLGGLPAEFFGLDPSQGAAFAGVNPFYGQNSMLFPTGRSVYNALQVSLRQRAQNVLGFLPSVTTQFGYSLSRFNSMVGDQDFVTSPQNQANPGAFFGRTSFDRTHQFTFGTFFTFPKAMNMAFIGHFGSPLPATLRLENQGRPGEIFITDVDGDGSFGDLSEGDIVPGQNIGTFMHSVTPGNINNMIANYNNTQVGTLTPAGQTLVNAGLFTAAQLAALGAVKQPLAPAPAGEVGNDWTKSFDLRLGAPIKIGERVTIDPNISIFNLFNFANFATSPASRISGILSGAAGSANGTVYNDQGNRAGLGSGVFAMGAPRQIEYGLRVTF